MCVFTPLGPLYRNWLPHLYSVLNVDCDSTSRIFHPGSVEIQGWDSLHTMMDISLSKLPKGKVLMRHRYPPSSATSVLMMTSDESKVGSLFLKRTRRDHISKATCTGHEEGKGLSVRKKATYNPRKSRSADSHHA